MNPLKKSLTFIKSLIFFSHNFKGNKLLLDIPVLHFQRNFFSSSDFIYQDRPFTTNIFQKVVALHFFYDDAF